jgi:hypothetical protein
MTARPGYRVDFVAKLGDGRRRLIRYGEDTVTHTYVTLEVSAAAFNEIKSKLEQAGYDHTFMDDGGIDMHGIALTKAAAGPGTSTVTINEAAHGLEDYSQEESG